MGVCMGSTAGIVGGAVSGSTIGEFADVTCDSIHTGRWKLIGMNTGAIAGGIGGGILAHHVSHRKPNST